MNASQVTRRTFSLAVHSCAGAKKVRLLPSPCFFTNIPPVCSVSARRVSYNPWSSAAIDSMSFKCSVYPGEVVYIRAVVVKVWDSSVECYALAMAEDRNSASPKMRLVSESFFSLVRPFFFLPLCRV
jgi:hypothetical protein